MSWRRAAAGLALGLMAAAASAQLPEGQAVTGFRLPEYDADGELKQQLYGETATFLPDGIIELTGLKIELFSKGTVSARIYSPLCAYDKDRKRAASKEHIRIVVEKGVLTGDGFAWNGENQQFQIFKNAKVVLDSQLDATRLVAPTPEAPEAGPETAPPAKIEE
ncbi:MAG TPA: hypothetical protein DCM68_06510 [Verrucomicrobia bacterium]|nr:hypothetical protein [Verrucomicrobiota bacterium]